MFVSGDWCTWFFYSPDLPLPSTSKTLMAWVGTGLCHIMTLSQLTYTIIYMPESTRCRSCRPTNSIRVTNKTDDTKLVKRTDEVRLLVSLFIFTPRYVPSVTKSSIWDQCNKKYILRTDRRPTNDLTFGKIKMAISPQGVIRSTSCLVLRWGFRGQRIEWCYFRCDHIQ